MIRTATNSVLAQAHVNMAQAIAVAPNGGTVYVSGADRGSRAGEVIAIPTATNVPGSPIVVSPDGDVQALAVTPDGKTIYAALNFNDEVVAIDAKTGQANPPIPVGANPSSLAISRDGLRMYVVNSNNHG